LPNAIYSCNVKLIFSIIIPVFSVTWYSRNHSNMLICCLRNMAYYWKQFYLETVIQFMIIRFIESC